MIFLQMLYQLAIKKIDLLFPLIKKFENIKEDNKFVAHILPKSHENVNWLFMSQTGLILLMDKILDYVLFVFVLLQIILKNNINYIESAVTGTENSKLTDIQQVNLPQKKTRPLKERKHTNEENKIRLKI